MNRQEVEEKINEVNANSQYVRVSAEHPLELYLGRNEAGYPTLRYNGNFQPTKLVGSDLLEIKQVKTANYDSLLFCYISNENYSLFYNFCEDIINQTSQYQGSDGYTEIINRYNQWKKMFYRSNKILSEGEIIGLIGELLFLKEFVFIKYGISEGINGWSGPETAHKDFSYKNEWYEIKAIHSGKNSVSISSIEQLDSDINGKLVVYVFEKMSESFLGITLNQLIDEISNCIKLDIDREKFYEKLKQVGYSYNEVYDSFVYKATNKKMYLVNDSFPKIRRKNMPIEIGKIEYELMLSLIEKYKEE